MTSSNLIGVLIRRSRIQRHHRRACTEGIMHRNLEQAAVQEKAAEWPVMSSNIELLLSFLPFRGESR